MTTVARCHGSIIMARSLANPRRRRRADHIFVVRTEDGLIVKRLGKTTAGQNGNPA